MVKKSKSRRRGIPRGVQKYKIQSLKEGSKGLLYLLEGFIPSNYVQQLQKIAEDSLRFYTKTVCKLYLVPLVVKENGELAKAPLKRLLVHYLLQTIFVVSMLHKMAVLFHRLAFEELDTLTFICATTFLCYCVAFSCPASCFFLPDETIDMINGWPKLLAYYSTDDDGITLKLINNTKTAIVITSLAALAMVIGFGIPVFFSFVFQALPVGWMPTAEAIGLIPEDTRVPRILWKFMFLPLEMFMYVPPMFMAGWSAMLLMLIVMVTRTCLDHLRFVLFFDF